MTKVQSIWVCGNLNAHVEPIILPFEATGTPAYYSQLPTPIALLATEYFQESQPFIKLHRMIDTAEMVVRFFFIVAVSDLHRQLMEFPPSFKDQLASRLYKPVFGEWGELLSTAIDLFNKHKLICLVSELPVVWNQIWKPLIGTNRGPSEREIIPLRNNIAHAGRLTDEAAQELLKLHRQRFEEAIQSLSFLQKYQLISVGSNREQYLLHGLPEAVSWTLPLLDTSIQGLPDSGVYLLNADERVSLFPLHAYLPVRQWNDEQGRFSTVDQINVPMIYLRYNVFRGWLEFTALASHAHFSQFGQDLTVPFLQLFNLPAWENERREKETLQAPKFEIQRLGYNFEDLIRQFPDLNMLVGRRSQLADVQKWIQTHLQEGGQLWVGGKPGAGKSAFMIGLWKRLATDKKLSLGCLIPFFFRSGDARSNLESFFHSAILHLTQSFPLKTDADLTKPLKEQFLQIIDALGRQYPNSGPSPRIIFLLDGIDEIGLRASELGQTLPSVKNSRCIWVLAGRGNIPISKGMDILWETGELAPLTSLDVRTMLEQELGSLRYGLYQRDRATQNNHFQNPFIETLLFRSEGLPLYIHLAVEDIRAGRLTTEDENKLPVGLKSYFNKLLERMAISDLSQILIDVMALLSWALEPISEQTLVTILAPVYPHGSIDLMETALRYGHVMLRKTQTGDQKWGWSLYHDSFRQYLQETDTLKNARHRAHELLLNWCSHWADHKNPYALRNYAQHLANAGRQQELFTLARNDRFYSDTSQLFVNNPAAFFSPLRLSIQEAYRSDRETETVEFMLAHAIRMNTLLTGETPIMALRSGNQARARQLASLANPEVTWHWHLIMAKELYELGRSEAAKAELTELTLLSNVKLSFFQKSSCKILVSLSPILTEPFLKVLPGVLHDDDLTEICKQFLARGYPSHVEQLVNFLTDDFWKSHLIKDLFFAWHKLNDREFEKVALERCWRDQIRNIRFLDKNVLWNYLEARANGTDKDLLEKAARSVEQELFESNENYSKSDQLDFFLDLSSAAEKNGEVGLAFSMLQKAINNVYLIQTIYDRAIFKRRIVFQLIQLGLLDEALSMAEDISYPEEQVKALNAVAQAMGEREQGQRAVYVLSQALVAGQAISAYVPKVEMLSATTLLISRFDTPENTRAAFAITKASEEFALLKLSDNAKKEDVIQKVEDLLTKIPFLGMTDTQKIIQVDLEHDIKQAQKAVRSLPTSDYANRVADTITTHLLASKRYREALYFALMIDSPHRTSLVLDCTQELIFMGDVDLASRALGIIEKTTFSSTDLFRLAAAWEHLGQPETAKRIFTQAHDASLNSSPPSGIVSGIKEIALEEFQHGEPIIAKHFVSMFEPSYLGYGQEGLVSAYAEANQYDQALQIALDIGEEKNRDQALETIVKNFLKDMQIERAIEVTRMIRLGYIVQRVSSKILSKIRDFNNAQAALEVLPLICDAIDFRDYDAKRAIDDFGVLFMDLGLWDAAIQVLELGLKPFPGDQMRGKVLGALLEIATDIAAQGDLATARLILEEFDRAKQDVQIDLSLQEANLLIGLGDFEEAAMISKKLENPDIQIKIAEAQMRTAQWGASFSTLTRLLHSDELDEERDMNKLAHIWFLLGLINEYLEQDREAENCYRQAFKIAHQANENLDGRAMLTIIEDLTEQGRFEQALEAAQQVADYEGIKFSAYLSIAEGQITQKDYSSAEATLQLALKNLPPSEKTDYIPGDRASAYTSVAFLYVKAGYIDQPRHLVKDAEFNAGFESWLQDDIYDSIGDVYAEMGDFSEALRVSSKIQDIQQRNRAFSSVAASQVRAGLGEDALQITNRITNQREELLLVVSKAYANILDKDHFGTLLVPISAHPESAIAACVQLAHLRPKFAVEIATALLKFSN
jgi:hypothetical protein